MSETVEPAQRRRSRVSLVLMSAIAVVPIAAAWIILYFFPGLIPTSTTNKGTLIRPALPLEQLSETARAHYPAGKWTLVVPAQGACGAACQHGIYLARQVNVALGKDAERVQRILLVAGNRVPDGLQPILQRDYPHMLVQFESPENITRALGQYGSPSLDGYVFLCDPSGNIMMYYSPANSGKDMLKDIKHLLGSTG